MTGKRSYNKAACKRLAAELRTEIDLDPMEALDPWQLAELYGIRVVALGSLSIDSAVREHFAVTRPEAFSGARTVRYRRRHRRERRTPVRKATVDDGTRTCACLRRA